jgi:hypothetical protein
VACIKNGVYKTYFQHSENRKEELKNMLQVGADNVACV